MRIAALLLSLGITLAGVYAAGSLALLAEGAWARLTLGLMASACLAIGLGGLMAVAGQRKFRLPTLLSCSSLPLLWLLHELEAERSRQSRAPWSSHRRDQR